MYVLHVSRFEYTKDAATGGFLCQLDLPAAGVKALTVGPETTKAKAKQAAAQAVLQRLPPGLVAAPCALTISH